MPSKISQMPTATTPPTGVEVLPALQGGLNVQIPLGKVSGTMGFVNVFSYMTAAQVAAVRAGTGSATLDRASIQAAFNALPTAGGILYLPPGTYKLDATYLDFRNKGNFTIAGAGMGTTFLDGSNHIAQAYPLDAIILLGVGGAAAYSNVTVRDFSIKGTNNSNTAHMISFRGINNARFENLEIYNGYNEVLYCDGNYPAFDGLTIKGCYFHDCYAVISSCIDTNSTGVYNIIVDGNKFERVSTGVFCLGRNVVITNNVFIDVNSGIQVGESNFNADPSVSSVVVSNNTFTGLGRNLVPFGGYAFATSRGIFVDSRAQTYTDNGADNGVVVSNNTFKDSYADVGTSCIEVAGGALITGNYCSGLVTNTSSSAHFIHVRFSSDVLSSVGVNSTPVHVFCSNNIMENKPGATYDYPLGLLVESTNNAYLYLSGNNFSVKAAGGVAALFTAASNGFTPFVSFNGDRFSPACYLYDLIGCDITRANAGVPIWGDNATGVSSNGTADPLWNYSSRGFTATATIDASKGSYFYTNNTLAQNITDIVCTSTSVIPPGKEISIFFNDANTTVVHNVNKIVLNGSANFVSSIGAILTLICPQVRNSVWYEKCRSKP